MPITTVRKRKVPQLLPVKYQNMIVEIDNLKYRCIGLLMLDCGLRPGEAARVTVGDFDFVRRTVTVHSLKKRGENHQRVLLMSERLLDALALYWKELKIKTPDSYLFPAHTETGYSDSKQVYKWFRKNMPFTPKQCRHTFASRAYKRTKDIKKVQRMLGHKSQTTTEIYVHIPEQEMDAAMELVNREQFLPRLKRKLFPPKRIFWTPVDNGITQFHVGRKAELSKLADLMGKRVNVLLLGEHGTGKTHLLQNMPDTDNRFIRMDDFNSTKKRLQNLLLELYQVEESMIEMVMGTKERSLLSMAATQEEKEATYGKIISRDSIDNLTDLAIKATRKQQYTIIIDDGTGINKAGKKVIEKLKNHFHIVMAARQLKFDDSKTVSNFEIIELKNLPRKESIDLIMKLSYKIVDNIEDLELYKNHIWDKTGGNPLYIYEFVERYKKEGFISNSTINAVEHTTGLKEVDLFPIVVMGIASLSALRYIVRGTGGDPAPYYLIAGVAMIFLFFGRSIMTAGKRRWI